MESLKFMFLIFFISRFFKFLLFSLEWKKKYFNLEQLLSIFMESVERTRYKQSRSSVFGDFGVCAWPDVQAFFPCK